MTWMTSVSKHEHSSSFPHAYAYVTAHTLEPATRITPPSLSLVPAENPIMPNMTCDVCGRLFNRKRDLDGHLTRILRGEEALGHSPAPRASNDHAQAQKRSHRPADNLIHPGHTIPPFAAAFSELESNDLGGDDADTAVKSDDEQVSRRTSSPTHILAQPLISTPSAAAAKGVKYGPPTLAQHLGTGLHASPYLDPPKLLMILPDPRLNDEELTLKPFGPLTPQEFQILHLELSLLRLSQSESADLHAFIHTLLESVPGSKPIPSLATLRQRILDKSPFLHE